MPLMLQLLLMQGREALLKRQDTLPAMAVLTVKTTKFRDYTIFINLAVYFYSRMAIQIPM